MHLILTDSQLSTPNDSAQNENAAILENIKQTNHELDHISESKNTGSAKSSHNGIPNGIPNGTPNGTPKGTPKYTTKSTPKSSSNHTPKSTLKSTQPSEVIGYKITENSIDKVTYNWESKKTADISIESDQNYDIPIPDVKSRHSNSDNYQYASNEDQLEILPVLTVDDHEELFTNQADHQGNLYIFILRYYRIISKTS